MSRLVVFVVGTVLCWGILGGTLGVLSLGLIALTEMKPTIASELSASAFSERVLILRIFFVALAMMEGLTFSIGPALVGTTDVLQRLGRWDLLWKLTGATAVLTGVVAVLAGAIVSIAYVLGALIPTIVVMMVLGAVGFILHLSAIRNPKLLEEVPFMAHDVA